MARKHQSGLVIRPFDEAFLDSCIALFVKEFNEPPWNETWNKDSASKRLRKVVLGKGFIGRVAYVEAGLVGFVLGNRLGPYPLSKCFHIREMVVAGPAQGTGIGRQLLESLKGDIKKKDVYCISLLTKKASPAEKFYSKSGFKRFPKYGSLKQMVLMRYSFQDAGQHEATRSD